MCRKGGRGEIESNASGQTAGNRRRAAPGGPRGPASARAGDRGGPAGRHAALSAHMLEQGTYAETGITREAAKVCAENKQWARETRMARARMRARRGAEASGEGARASKFWSRGRPLITAHHGCSQGPSIRMQCFWKGGPRAVLGPLLAPCPPPACPTQSCAADRRPPAAAHASAEHVPKTDGDCPEVLGTLAPLKKGEWACPAGPGQRPKKRELPGRPRPPRVWRAGADEPRRRMHCGGGRPGHGAVAPRGAPAHVTRCEA